MKPTQKLIAILLAVLLTVFFAEPAAAFCLDVKPIPWWQNLWRSWLRLF